MVIFSLSSAFGQELLLTKTWKVDYSISNSVKILPEIGKQNTITFFANHSFHEVEDNNLMTGNWQYFAKNKIILINNNEFPVKIKLQVIKLTKDKLIFNSHNEDGSRVTVYLSCQKQS